MILLECGNFDRDQYAYLKKRSGTQALLLLVEKVKKEYVEWSESWSRVL